MKLAIFDIDGTLTNTNSVDDECFVQALAEAHAISGISTNWGEYPHTTDSGILAHIFQEQFGREHETRELEKFQKCFVGLLGERYQSNASCFDEISGAGEAFGRLKREAEWAVAVATGCWRASALLKLEAAGIEIDGVAAAFAEDGLSREEILAAAVRRAAAQCGLKDFGKIVSIGDGVWDVRAAARCGFAFLGVGSDESEAGLRQAGAKHVIEDFDDFNQFMRCLDEAEIPATVR